MFGSLKSCRHQKQAGALRVLRSQWARVVVASCALLMTNVLSAQEVLDYLPEDALGFVLIRDLSEASGKCEKLMRVFEVESPAPWAFFQRATGLGEGLDQNGDLLVALLPGPRDADPPEPLVVLPVADYAKFAASVNGDESGEVCRVSIAGEDVLVAQHGSYAMLMNVENRETLEILIGLEPAPVEFVRPWTAWLNDNEATLAILAPGVDRLLQMGRRNLAQQRQEWNQEFGQPEFADVLGQMQQSLTVYQMLMEMFGTKVEAAAVGFSLSAPGDLRLGLRVLTERALTDSEMRTATEPISPLAGYPDKPFVLAGGGPMSGTLVRALTAARLVVMKRSPEIDGYQNFDDQAWKDLETSYLDLGKNIRSMTVLMLTGEKGDPLFGNFYGISTVANASEYLETYKKSVETWNRLATLSTSDIQLHYEIHDIKVGGAEACEVLVDVAAAARDPNVPMFNWMLESMFGKEGKLRMLLVAADEKTLVFGLAGEEQMVAAIEQLKQQERGLRNSADVQTTTKLLQPEAAWKLYVSPEGCVNWFQRVMDELFGQIVQQATQFPEYTAGPPVGISLHMHGAQGEVDVVWPAESLKSLADFVRKSKEL